MTAVRAIGVSSIAIATALTTGCGAPSRQNAFADVAHTLEQRQPQRIHWNNGSADDAAVATQVHGMLAHELSVDDVVQIALLNNRRLQAVYEDLGIAQADLVRAGLLRNPVFGADVRFATGGGVNVGLDLVQNFLDVLYIPLRKRVAEQALEGAKARVADAVIDLAAEVRRAAYRYQTMQQALEMRRTVVEAVSASFELSQRLHDAGNTTDIDLAEQRGLLEQAKLDLGTDEAGVVADGERLTSLMALWGPDTAWRLSARLAELPEDDGPLDGLEGKAVRASLGLVAAKQDVAVAAQRLGIARPMDVVNDSTLGVSAERDTSGEWVVGPAISVPLPLFNQGQAAVLAAQSELRRAQATLYAEAVEVRSRTRLAAARLQWARQRVRYLFTVVLPLRQTIVDRLQEQYNGMLASPFRLIQAKQQQIDAGAQYVEALGMYWSARASLDQILMGGQPPDDGSGPSMSARMGDHPNEGGH